MQKLALAIAVIVFVDVSFTLEFGKLGIYVTKLAKKYNISSKIRTYISFFMKNNISTKNLYFKESELTQISVDFRHLKIFLISKMYSSCPYACIMFVLLHENHRKPRKSSGAAVNVHQNPEMIPN